MWGCWGGFWCSAPQYGRGLGGDRRDTHRNTHTHTGTYTRMLHLPFSDLPLKTSPIKPGESSEKSSGENRVKSCHVCGCHGFFAPDDYTHDCQPQHAGQVRPRQGTEVCNFGAPSPLEALHWIFCFFSSTYVQFSKTSPLKPGESSEKSSGENRVKSCHVCGCHGFSRP